MASSADVTQSTEKLRLMAKVARMYHERGQRQSQIAEELNVSQARVSRLLKAAQDAGVVRTIVTMPAGVHSDVEEALEQRFGLRAALVVEAPLGEESVPTALAAAAAGYLESTVFDEEVIGVSSWSATLLGVVDALPALHGRTAKQVVQLVGGRSVSALQLKANRLLTRLAALTGAQPAFLNAPGMAPSKREAESLLRAPYLEEATASWNNLTLALVGIGSLEPSPLARQSGNAFPPEALDELRSAGAVGDICFRFFDADGAAVSSELSDAVVGIDAATLRAVPRRVGVAGGAQKTEAVLGALRGGWINVLVTDLETAERLLVNSDVLGSLGATPST